MPFISDNTSGVCPEIMQALFDTNRGYAVGYGDDETTGRMQKAFNQIFETEVYVFPVATGTAANALALSALCPPWGAIFCHESAHIEIDECGAPEFYTGGAKIIPLAGPQGKLLPDDLDTAIARLHKGDPHQVQPGLVSITQVTEAGTVYTLDEVHAIAGMVKKHGLKLHMDGARFANAVAALGCSVADLTWRAGVDALSFGATKNGAMAAEAVVIFRKEQAQDFVYRRKRGGHLFCKMRFISAQFEAYLTDDLWLKNAVHANRMASRLAEALTATPGVTREYPTEANQVFVRFSEHVKKNLRENGYSKYAGDHPVVRLVTSFNTTEAEIDAFVNAAKRGL